VPMRAFREKFGDLSGEDIAARLHDFVRDFLAHEPKDGRSTKSEVAHAKADGGTDGRIEHEAVKSR